MGGWGLLDFFTKTLSWAAKEETIGHRSAMVLIRRHVAMHADEPSELVQEDLSHGSRDLHVVVMVTVVVDLQHEDTHRERDADEYVRVGHVVN